MSVLNKVIYIIIGIVVIVGLCKFFVTIRQINDLYRSYEKLDRKIKQDHLELGYISKEVDNINKKLTAREVNVLNLEREDRGIWFETYVYLVTDDVLQHLDVFKNNGFFYEVVQLEEINEETREIKYLCKVIR